MHYIKMFFVAVMVVGFSLITNSLVFAACSDVSCVGKIQRLYIDAGTLYIATDGDEKLLNCTPPAGVYVTMPVADESFKTKYAMVLTALSLDLPVGLRIVNGSATCSVAYVYMDK